MSQCGVQVLPGWTLDFHGHIAVHVGMRMGRNLEKAMLDVGHSQDRTKSSKIVPSCRSTQGIDPLERRKAGGLI